VPESSSHDGAPSSLALTQRRDDAAEAVVGDAPPEATARERPWDRTILGVRVVRLAYPAVLLVAVMVLSLLDLSGTSIGMLRYTPGRPIVDPSLVVGTPRGDRSDEWAVVTPLIVAQFHHGFPRFSNDSIGRHDDAVIPDLPARDWPTMFKPWDVPLLVSLNHGFAARWWLMSFVLLVGIYLLLLELTDRTALSVLLSLGLWLSPFFHWWYDPGSLVTVGFGALATGALLYGLRATSRPRRWAWLALAAYGAVGFVLVLYPPFQIPVAVVLAAVAGGEIVGALRERRLAVTRIVADVGLVAGVCVIALAAWYLHVRGAIAAINGTVYPGHRGSTGGGTSSMQLLSAPFGVQLASHGDRLQGTNQSEISSFLLLGPFAIVQAFWLGFRRFSVRFTYTFALTATAFTLVAAWYLVGLPSIVGKVLLLDRTPGPRAIIGIGVGGVILMALLCGARFRTDAPPEAAPETPLDDGPPAPTIESRRERRRWRRLRRRVIAGAALCGLACFALYLWGGLHLAHLEPSLGLSTAMVLAFSLASAVVVFLLCGRMVVAGGIALVLLGAVVSLPANPLYRGLGELTRSPVLPVFAAEAASPPDAAHRVWLSYEPGGSALTDVLEASGLQSLAVASVYPDAPAWRILDPNGRSADAWNRYANLYFTPAPDGAPVAIHLDQADRVRITLDPCGPVAGRLGVGFVVTTRPLTNSCLTLDRALDQGGMIYIYRRGTTP
jgi:hypothetical protein